MAPPAEDRHYTQREVEEIVKRRLDDNAFQVMGNRLDEVGKDVKAVKDRLAELEASTYDRAVDMTKRLGVYRGSPEELDTLRQMVAQEAAREVGREDHRRRERATSLLTQIVQAITAIGVLLLALHAAKVI